MRFGVRIDYVMTWSPCVKKTYMKSLKKINLMRIAIAVRPSEAPSNASIIIYSSYGSYNRKILSFLDHTYQIS